MKILFVNKFLYLKGGAETYIYKLGMKLREMGHEVEYFGMKDERNIMCNTVNAYASEKDFRSEMSLRKLLYPFEIIYSFEAVRKIRQVIENFRPDVVHLNNINFQITPSVIHEIKRHGIPIVWTAHDYQLICPDHMLYIPHKGEVCEKCVGGSYWSCLKNKCIHGSAAQSAVAVLEGTLYKHIKLYGKVDRIICPSEFLKRKLESRSELRNKCIVMHNFNDRVIEETKVLKEDYVLYFGRFDREKGIRTLVDVCRELKDIRFIFAGSGEFERELSDMENVRNVGFKSGEDLEILIRKALVTICPSEWYENCPFSVIESLMIGTPVIGADIGGISELIQNGKNGLLFESGNKNDLKEKIEYLWKNRSVLNKMSENCPASCFDDTRRYCEKLTNIYRDCMNEG